MSTEPVASPTPIQTAPSQPRPAAPLNLTAPLAQKLAVLRQVIRGYGPSLIAFSGGVDSALVLKIAADELGEQAVAMTAVSETMAEREIGAAADFVRSLGARYEPVTAHELERPGFAQNPTDRCYHCKSELLELCEPLAKRLGLASILLGTNLDDLGDHRPGLVAARERGARQPLVEASLNKAEVRTLAQALGLPLWDKPQLACLSSRFPYGTTITPARLRMVDRLEQGLQDLGFRQLRVRFHEVSRPESGGTQSDAALARIEVEAAELERAFAQRAELSALARRVGFVYATLDLDGFRSGSANVVLTQLGRPRAPSPAPAPTPAAPSKPAARPRKIVVAGLCRSESGAVFLSQRRADQAMPLLWELPGGKVEPGELPEEALRRELREELDVDAQVDGIYEVIGHRYPEFDLVMMVYKCRFDREPRAAEVAAVRWVAPGQLGDLPILPADLPLVERLRREAETPVR